MLKIFWLGYLNKKINFKFLNFNKILNYSAIFLFDIIKEKSVNNSLSSKRPPEKVKPNTKKSLKRNSKYFKQPTEGLSGSETEEIPSSPEPEEKTVKKPEISDTSKNNKPSIIQNKVQSPSSIKILSKSSKTKNQPQKLKKAKNPQKKKNSNQDL